jgi:hypothetical protein
VKRQILALLPLAALVLAACGTGSSGTLTLTSSSSATGTSGTPRAFAVTATGKPARTPVVPTSTKVATATKVAATTKAATTAPTNAPANIAAPAGAHTWYTSSAGNAKYYYCDLDDGWKTLSAKNLRSYSSESALLAAFPTRSKYPTSKC